MTGRDCFEAAIDAALAAGRHPGPERQVYADWLDEQGDCRLAHAQRWMAETGATPWGQWEKGWHWATPDGLGVSTVGPTTRMLPRPLLKLVKRQSWVRELETGWIVHRSRQKAEQALADALADLADSPD